MSKLIAELASRVEAQMRAMVRTLQRPDAELRSVFHGPPVHYMQLVLERLASEDGLQLELADGTPVTLPVLLPAPSLANGRGNPAVGASGLCDRDHLIALRNTPACPRFLTLATPGQDAILSLGNTRDEFGVAQAANGGSATVDDWWHDRFVQEIVDAALSRTDWRGEKERADAVALLERAVRAADAADQHNDRERRRCWAALARVLAISDPSVPFATQWSLACGFPPTGAGVDKDQQTKALRHLVELVENNGFAPTAERLRQGASEDEQLAIDLCLRHLRDNCDRANALTTETAPFYFGPCASDDLSEPPRWWSVLTSGRLIELMEQDSDGPAPGALGLECTNALVKAGRGLPIVVAGPVELRFSGPAETDGPLDGTVTRQAPGKGNRREWIVDTLGNPDVRDDGLPPHERPVPYVALSGSHKKATVRVVSLASWGAGVVVTCRNAVKLELPRRTKAGSQVTHECNLSLSGEARHFLDIHVASGIALGPIATGEDASTAGAAPLSAMVVPPVAESGGPWGVDLLATSECYYDLAVQWPDGTSATLRLNITCVEAPSEGCRSVFDRLVRVNRAQDRTRGGLVVQIDRQSRLADLQAWALDADAVARSFYPVVISSDCAECWRPPSWETEEGTVISRGRFLHDPRPSFDELVPPEAFVLARTELAARIRGEDGHGLMEAAELGLWLQQAESAELLDAYVRAYFSWLSAAPDAAAWVDLVVVTELERDGRTLAQEPDAVLVSPLHPLRLAWQALAQRVLLDASRAGMPCPAGSILDPDGIPDILALPLRTAGGSTRRVPMLATECGSDSWAVLWNGTRVGRLGTHGALAPFDKELGLQLGGVTSGFSASQVCRALDDVATLLTAKPILNVLVASSLGQSEACNEGLLDWARDRFSVTEAGPRPLLAMGSRELQVYDERSDAARPEASEIANLAEDTDAAVRWYAGMPAGPRPDLGIIAQLETTNAGAEQVSTASPLSTGALVRHRIRTQLSAGAGAFLSESRMATAGPPSGDALADHVAATTALLENLGDTRQGFTFAPSVQAVSTLVNDRKAEFTAVSSSAVDPACFLGGWLEGAYLWDYELPSYSHRAGDTSGYYLLSRVKDVDREALRELLKRLPGCDGMDDEAVSGILFEVARRGIPTVRGLSAGHSGAAGDLGLFMAGRLLQDEFRGATGSAGLLPVLRSDGEVQEVALVIPVDPFRGYMQDLQRALGMSQLLRPDLLVAAMVITDSSVRIRVTPVEVKYRQEVMSTSDRRDALAQSAALAELLEKARSRGTESGLVIWQLAFQHLLLTMLDFGFRVYSQQPAALRAPADWSRLHQRVSAAILGDLASVEIDAIGRLVVFDGSPSSAQRDVNDDGHHESIIVNTRDGAEIVHGRSEALVDAIRTAVGDWGFYPTGTSRVQADMQAADLGASRPSSPAPSETKSENRPMSVTTPVQSPEILKDATEPTTGASTWVDSDTTTSAVDGDPFDGTYAPISTGLESAVREVPVPNDQQLPAAPPPMRPISKPDGIGVIIGSTVDDFRTEEKLLRPSMTRLNQLNMGVVGDLGTGKTQLVKSIVYQIASSSASNDGIKPRFLIFDYKKDYAAADFVEAVGAKVVMPHQLPLNLFDTRGTVGVPPWMPRFKFFADVLGKIYSGIGPVQLGNLKQAVKTSYERAKAAGREATIYDVHDTYHALVQGKLDAPLSIISDMVDMELFTKEPLEAGAFERFLDGVVVLSLDQLGQDDRTKNMVVAIMLNLFYEHMLRLPKRPYRGTDPQLRTVDSYLLVDEADNIMRYEFDVLRSVLLQAREFGVGVILASQFLRHFKAGATDYREPLLSWFIHKVPNVTAQELAALGMPGSSSELAARVQQLENHQCLFKTFDVPGVVVQGLPFYKLLQEHRGQPAR
ncbi:MAG: hypothetical protein IT355_13235 [Gemmatimonadaceae bacterium]|nr:hypothetical protein [Gemmatimonadaceae bacterium]